MATIRDETDVRPWDVDPVSILQWVLAPWRTEEKAEVSEFILVSNEDAKTNEESKLLDTGCAPFGLKSSDGRTYRTPDGGTTAIICINRDFAIARRAHQGTRSGPLDIWYARLKYTVNLRRLMTREANVALASSRLQKAHGDSILSRDELWYRQRELWKAVERRYLRRIAFSRAFPAIVLLVLAGVLRKDRFPLTYSGMEDIDSQIRATAAIRAEIKADVKSVPPKTDGQRLRPIVRDESGEHVCGIDPAAVIRWALATYPDENLMPLREIIVVASDYDLERAELDLMTRGARPAQHKSPTSCTYALPADGAVMVMNIGRLRRRVVDRLEKKAGGILASPLARLYFVTMLRYDVIDQIQDGVAYAHLAELQRSRTFTQEEVDARFSFFRSEFWGPAMKRQFRSTLIPASLLLIAAGLVLKSYRRNENTGGE